MKCIHPIALQAVTLLIFILVNPIAAAATTEEPEQIE